MSLYSYLGKDGGKLVAFDLRAANGIEQIWMEVKWDEFEKELK